MDPKRVFADQRAALQKAVAEAGLSKEWTKIEPFVRDSIALRPAKLPKTKAKALGLSRLGGSPDLPADVAWPESGGVALAFLGQIALDDVHRWDVHGLLPADGWLTFFVGHGVDKKGVYGPIPHVLHIARKATLERRKTPAGVVVADPVALEIEGKSVLWPFGGKGPKVKDPYASVYMRMYDVGGPTRHHALFGTDRAREGLVDPKKDEVLLRLDRSDDVPYDFEESSVLYLVASRSDLLARRFDRVRAVDASTV